MSFRKKFLVVSLLILVVSLTSQCCSVSNARITIDDGSGEGLKEGTWYFTGTIKIGWWIFVFEEYHYKAAIRLENVYGDKFRVASVVSVYDIPSGKNKGIVSIKLKLILRDCHTVGQTIYIDSKSLSSLNLDLYCPAQAPLESTLRFLMSRLPTVGWAFSLVFAGIQCSHAVFYKDYYAGPDADIEAGVGAEFIPKYPDDYPLPCAGLGYEFWYESGGSGCIKIVLEFQLGHTTVHDRPMMVADAGKSHSVTVTL